LFISKLLDDYKIILGYHSSLMKIFFFTKFEQMVVKHLLPLEK